MFKFLLFLLIPTISLAQYQGGPQSPNYSPQYQPPPQRYQPPPQQYPFLPNTQNNGCEGNYRWILPGQQSVISQTLTNLYECTIVFESCVPLRMRCPREDFNVVPSFQGRTGFRVNGEAHWERRNFANMVEYRTTKLKMVVKNYENRQMGSFKCIVEAVPQDCECGRPNVGKIHGGEPTSNLDYPMMASILLKEHDAPSCGATIINPKQVLTAAHCVMGVTTTGASVLVALGSSSPRLYEIERIIKHNEYNHDTGVNDIALVTVKGYIQFSNLAGPACLPFCQPKQAFVSESVDILGYGSTDFWMGPSQTLRKATISVVNMSTCGFAPGKTDHRFMCTQTVGKDSCTNDSGGPLLLKHGSPDRRYLIGLVSAGSSSCDGRTPATNIRVGPFLNWIEQNTPQGVTYCKTW